MSEEREMREVREMRGTTEGVLSARFGGRVRLDDGADLGGSARSFTYRYVVVDGPEGLPASVVAKKARAWEDEEYDPEAMDGPAAGMLNDWAGLEFLNEVLDGASLAPVCHGGDRAAGLLVMQDMGSPRGLDHILMGDDAEEAEEALVQMAAALGRMHAATIGHSKRFAEKRGKLGPTRPATWDWLRARTRELEEALELGIGPEVNEQIDDVIDALNNPGPFAAYAHMDPCPDNCLWVDGRIVLLDFERGAYRHALLDGSYGRIHFPTCWCVNQIPGHIPLRMEDEYRRELVVGCPQAGDDATYRRAVVAACASGAIGTWRPKLMEEDAEWGLATHRQRVLLRFYLFGRLAEEYGQFEALGRWLDLLGSLLREVWGEVEDMPFYPAFREGA